ncbi:SDR family oxidoreductase [Actinopolymorpha pittospori]
MVTGATGGIGFATARLLSERGYMVYAGIRGEGGALTDLPGVRLLPMDVSDPDSVAAAAEQVRLDVGEDGLRAVVNNAGIIIQGPLELVPPAQLRQQFEVNTFGPAYVIQTFLPLLRAGGGRVVNVSAVSGRVAVPFMAPISASKAALESLSNALRLELAAWNVPVVVVEPGTTDTAIFAKAGAATEAALERTDQRRVALYRDHLAAVEKAFAKYKAASVDGVSRTILAAVEADRPKRRYTVGDARFLALLTRIPAGLRDRIIERTLGLRGAGANLPTPVATSR